MASLSTSIAKVGSNTFLSRVMGFVRDLVVARVFGADAGTDAFFVAFKIPNFMRRLFAEGAFSMAFVPVLNEYKTTHDTPELKRFVGDVAGTFDHDLDVVLPRDLRELAERRELAELRFVVRVCDATRP